MMFMIEVFKTNVNNPCHASMLVYRIQQAFREYTVNFDLEDCDRILRVKSASGAVQALPLIEFLQKNGCAAEVLPDEYPAINRVRPAGVAGALHG
jgi:hypothetical protein